MSNWELNYAETDQWEWYHPDHDEHYLLVAQAAPGKEEDWYVLPHIGCLDPSDDRYDGPDRIPCTSIHGAQKVADRYLARHPDGHDPDELDAPQQSYDPDTGKSTPV